MFPVRLEVGVTYFLEYSHASRSQAVNRWPFPEQTVVRCRASSREICDDQSGTGCFFFSLSIYFAFPPSVVFQQYYILIFMLLLLLPEGKRAKRGNV